MSGVCEGARVGGAELLRFWDACRISPADDSEYEAWMASAKPDDDVDLEDEMISF